MSGHALDSDRGAEAVDAAGSLVATIFDEFCMSSVFAGTLGRLSTARLQEVRRAVDFELAGRMVPHSDLRDEHALAGAKTR